MLSFSIYSQDAELLQINNERDEMSDFIYNLLRINRELFHHAFAQNEKGELAVS